MGRGRKPMVSNLNDWQSVFYNSVGSYVQLINLELAKTIDSEPLSKHIRIAGGFAFKSSSYVSKGIPVIRISDFNDEKIILDNVKFYKESDDLKKYELNPGDIVIALTGGTIAKLGIVQGDIGKMYLNQRVGKFEVLNPSEFEAEYVYWIARSVQSIIKELAWGAAIPNVSPKDIEKLEFPIPDRNTQKGIISFLNDLKNNTLQEYSYFNSEIEKKIVSTHQNQVDGGALSTELTHQLDLVKQLRQAFLREAMQGKLVPQDPKDEPASVLLEKIKAEKERLVKEKKIKKQKPLPPITLDEIPFEIPENWVWCRLGEISQINPRNYLDENTEVGFCPMPLIFSEYGKDVEFETRKWKEIKSGFTHFANNDVVVAKITPCFQNSKAALINGLPNGFGAGTTELYVMRSYKRELASFIYCFIKTPEFLNAGERIMRGVAGQQRVPREYVETHLIPFPPLPEQQRIVAKLDELMQYCDALESSIKESQQQNELLLQQVLREALEPKEMDKETF
ncbi:restriction endonuclease subunit S [Robiginitalea sp.]|nr:restriction endonuclease subunit S [Robiginitalea sp.]